MRDQLLNFARGRATRRMTKVAMRGRPPQLRAAMWAGTKIAKRTWRRLDAAEQREVQRLMMALARDRRLAAHDRARLQQLGARLRGARA